MLTFVSKTNMKARKDSEKGFTLLELLVAITLMTIIIASGVPAILHSRPTYQIRGAARQIMADMRLAKMRAINTRQTCGVYFNLGSGTILGTDPNHYTVFIDDGSTAGQLDANDTIIKSNVALPGGITLRNPATPADRFTNNTALFYPRSASNGGQIQVVNKYNRVMTVDVLRTTARIRIIGL